MLSNFKILDLTRLLPGDFCTQILADLGMQVLKVEDTFGGDYIRYVPPLAPVGESTFFLALNRNKKSMRLNLKTNEGKEIFKKLVAEYDCVIEGFRPDVLAGLGFSFEELKKINPQIVYCTITGYGYESSHKYKAGHDLNYISLAGVLSLNQENENSGINSIFPVQIADISGALYSAIGILATLLARNQTKSAYFVDVPMFATAMSFITHYLSRYSCEKINVTKDKQELAGFLPSYSIYKTKENKYISLAALEPKFWDKFCEKINRNDLKVMGLSFTDAEKVKEELNKLFMQKTQKEWEEEFTGTDFCCESVKTLKDVCSDEEHKKDELIIYLKTSEDDKGIASVNLPFKINNARPKLKLYPPKIGEHTKEVLEGLGFGKDEIKNFKENGVV